MYKPMTLLALLMAGFLTACGGDDGGSVVQGGDGTGDSGDNSGSEDVTTGTEITSPRIGTGVGSDFNSGALEATLLNLSAGGTTQIQANIVDADSGNKKIVSKSYAVVFSSRCSGAEPAQASFSKDQLITSSGEVSATYEAKGCSGEDIVSFTLYDVENGVANLETALDVATLALQVEPPEVGAITYTGITAPRISINRIGDPVLPKLTTVSFTVLDQTNNPIEGKTVNFSLTNNTGGVNLAVDSAVTDESGVARAIVQSGSAHTTVSVRATTMANDGVTVIGTSSQPISVTTGIADQDSFAIAAEITNPASYDVQGVEVEITAVVGDQFQNPVADNTIVTFTAESGSFVEASCLTEGGRCSVTWYSGAYRPGQENDFENSARQLYNEHDPRRVNNNVAETVFGMTTILAYTQGSAGFTDTNNNGVYDVGEPYEEFAEAVRDDDRLNLHPSIHDLARSLITQGGLTDPENYFPNIDIRNDEVAYENAVYDEGEFVAQFNPNGVRDGKPGYYQGALCSDAALALGHCASLMYVRSQVNLAQATSNSVAFQVLQRNGDDFTPFTGSLGASGSFYVYVMDGNLSFPGNGTTLDVSGDGYATFGGGEVGDGWTIMPSTYTGLLSSYGRLFAISYEAEDEPEKISLSITTPGGAEVGAGTLR